MTWQILASRWLAQSALGGLMILGLGSLAAWLCRPPVLKARLAVLTLACALVVPWLGLVPGTPRWSAPILPAIPAPPEATAAALAVPRGSAEASIPRLSAPIIATTETHTRRIASRDPAAARAKRVIRGDRSASRALLPLVQPRWGWAFAWTPLTLVLAAYGLATAVQLGWWLLGQGMLWRICRAARPVAPEVLAIFRDISGPAGRRVRLIETDGVALPHTFTWLRPTILLPRSLCAEGDSVELRYSLAHECSHVERHDWWAWTLAGLAGCVLFYQPLVWWLRRQLRLCQDFLADDRAASLGSPEDYAVFLVRVARCRQAGPFWPALGIGDRRSNLHRRVVMLIQDRAPLERSCRLAWSAAASLVASVAVLAASGLRLDAAPAPPPQDKEAKVSPETKDAPKAETLSYSGTVRDKDTGQPIAGATVTVRRSIVKSAGENRTLQETKHTTDAEGKYHFTIPPEQVAEKSLYIELDVEHPNYATQAGFGYALGMIRKNEGLGGRPFFENIELRPGQPITGRVQGPDGQPAKGVEVLAYSVTTKTKNTGMEYGSFQKVKTNDRGEFRAVLTTPGLAVFWILPSDAAPEVHRVPEDQRGDLGLFVLKRGAPLKGRVLDAQGKPVAGVFVNAEHQRNDSDNVLEGMMVADMLNRSAVTDADGRFALAPLPAGNYTVKPDEHARDGSSRERKEVPAVFVAKKLTIQEGATSEPLEIRAAPHVVIEAQWLDGKGQPTWGFESHIFGQIDGTFWFGQAKPDDKGKVVARVPHGLENVQLNLMTNEHGSIKYRTAKGEPLHGGRRVMLGTLDHDVKGIEIHHYKAPLAIVKVETKDGGSVANAVVSADYADDDNRKDGQMILANGVLSDVSFEKQEDGRYRSMQLSPDREVTLKAQAEGYTAASTKVKLPEGETKEVVLTLEKK
jgi:beta-lactamase regulating signal transducer with metallopeptidase domain/uncharacterized GH25 family protein